jgi:hypothetical protein
MAVLAAIETILVDDALDDDACEDSKCERIERLIANAGWDRVRESMLDLLTANRRVRDYQVAAEVLWAAALDGRELPADRVIALLYHRFDPRGDNEDNLVWSITSTLKGVGYLSEYRPLQDPDVQAELAAIRAG